MEGSGETPHRSQREGGPGRALKEWLLDLERSPLAADPGPLAPGRGANLIVAISRPLAADGLREAGGWLVERGQSGGA
eukprot:8867682-Lingulodinium_polyedra.AAC.1